jgi:biopolymer transport protein ExbB
MIGLLGTVLGMMKAFESIARLGTGDSKVVAEGINGALLTTAAGLIAAIPAMFFYNFLMEKNDILIGDMKKVGLEIINNLRKRKILDE